MSNNEELMDLENAAQNVAEETADTADEAATPVEEPAAADAVEEVEEIIAEPAEDVADVAVEAADFVEPTLSEQIGETAEVAPAKKKKRFIQLPVIISLCIVLLAVVGYFTYTFFFLREPEGVLWSTDYDGVTYYYEFREGGIFKTYVGSVELTGTYEKLIENDTNYMTVSVDSGDFYAGQQAKYEITGSRILNDQQMRVSYEQGTDFTLNQAKEKNGPLELPADFTPDEELVDKWVFSYYGYDYCTVVFNEDGSMSISYPQNGVTYNGTYTIEDGKVNFTYFIDESIVQPIEYSIDNDVLTFMEMPFVRASSLATANEAAN